MARHSDDGFAFKSATSFQKKLMSYYGALEHRALRAKLIRRWKPWEKSTGPKSEDGKRRSAMRGYKGGERQLVRALARAMRGQRRATNRPDQT